ncbi:MAG TPA: glycerate dehydrogenase, partial [Kiloniellaceae bacterium]|nr:glycerate dehydrogenase [Kiloniellaceae bacterium]
MVEAVFLDLDSVDRGDMDLATLRAAWPRWRFHRQTRPQQVVERLRGVEVAVTNKVVLDAETLASAPALKMIAIAATGTNNVDLTAAKARGIIVANVRGYATPSVVQHVFGLMLALTLRLSDYREAVRQGAWGRSEQFCLLDFPIRELAGKTLGVVGYGELGHAVTSLAEAFGMRVQIAQRPGGPERPGRVPLDALLADADVLTLHCPLADNTRNLIGARELRLMKNDALLINTARGGIVDEEALAEALRLGEIGGAGVDVLTREPPVEGNPLLDE